MLLLRGMLKTTPFMVVKMSKNFFKFKRHSLALQRAKIKQDWPEGVFTNVSYKKFVWLVKIKPTNISRNYDISHHVFTYMGKI